MSRTHPIPLIDDRYHDAHQRFRELERAFQEEREAIARGASEALALRREAIEERVSELAAVHDEILALGEAVVAHPEVRDLPEARATLPATVHEATPNFVLRDIHARQQARVAALLPGLELTPPPVEPEVDATSEPAVAPTSDPEEEFAALGETAEPATCPHCGEPLPPESGPCAACGREPWPASFAGDDDTGPPEVEGRRPRGCAWAFVALVVVPLVGVAFLNAQPGLLHGVPVLCDVPLLSAMLPCAGVHVRGDACDVRTSAELSQRLSAIASSGGGSVAICPGTYEVRTSSSLSGNVTIRGSTEGATLLRIVDGGNLSHRGPGTFVLTDIAIDRSTANPGNVLSVTNATVRFERVAFSGGRGTPATAGAGLLLGGTTTGTVRDCIVRANGFGIWLSGRARPTIERCTIADNLMRGVSYHDQSGGELRDSTIENNGFNEERRDHWQGIAVQQDAAPSIRNNTIRNNAGIGIQYWNASGGSASGNQIIENGWNIHRYAETEVSAGGIAIGVLGRQRDHQPTPTVARDNVYANNYGGTLNDYRR